MKKLIKMAVLIAALYCSPLIAQAEDYYIDADQEQLADGDVLPSPGGDADAVNAPIDGGLSVLLAAGMVYGIKRSRSKRKQQVAD